MTKAKYSLNCDVGIMEKIDKAAKKNGLSRSTVVRMLLKMVDYVPIEKLQETSPVPELLGIKRII